jgi:hypothetical protein
VPDGEQFLGVASADIEAAKERDGEQEDREHIIWSVGRF